MPILGPFKALRSTGAIVQAPCAVWQYRYAIDDYFDYTTINSPIVRGHWRAQILASDDTVIFDQVVEFKYYIITLTAGSALILFVWYIDLQNQHITTAVPENVQTIGGEQGYADPAGGSDFTAEEGHIQFDWYSGVYMVPLPAGSRFRIVYHNVGMNALWYNAANVAIAAAEGGVGVASLHTPEDGVTRLVLSDPNGGLRYLAGCDVRGMGVVAEGAWPHSTQPAPTQPYISARVVEGTATNPRLRRVGHQLLLIFDDPDGAWLMLSASDGYTWGDPMLLSDQGQRIGDVLGPDGGTLYILQARGSDFVFITCSRELVDGAQQYRATDEYPAEGLEGVPASPQSLEFHNGLLRLLVDTGGAQTLWVSSDLGRTWQ